MSTRDPDGSAKDFLSSVISNMDLNTQDPVAGSIEWEQAIGSSSAHSFASHRSLNVPLGVLLFEGFSFVVKLLAFA